MIEFGKRGEETIGYIHSNIEGFAQRLVEVMTMILKHSHEVESKREVSYESVQKKLLLAE